jgi:hypothetical protein
MDELYEWKDNICTIICICQHVISRVIVISLEWTHFYFVCSDSTSSSLFFIRQHILAIRMGRVSVLRHTVFVWSHRYFVWRHSFRLKKQFSSEDTQFSSEDTQCSSEDTQFSSEDTQFSFETMLFPQLNLYLIDPSDILWQWSMTEVKW